MKTPIALMLTSAVITTPSVHAEQVREVVYVESPTDTDKDGKTDLIYVSINRPNSSSKLSTIYKVSPYNLGGNRGVRFHDTNVDDLPQNVFEATEDGFYGFFQKKSNQQKSLVTANRPIPRPRYAYITADSVGTGRSTGCPTVGDMNETLAAKAVIDWLNGRAKAYQTKNRTREVKADWANGKVAMQGVSYNGTLPTMVATTGVQGLKVIVPIAAISNWYNYYRANGLVVGPGGYIGEDADILGKFIVRRNACRSQINAITNGQGREHGDYTPFWAKRNYLPKIKDIKAATFVVHGQSDWNVRPRHALELWGELGNVPKRMHLHRGAHSNPGSTARRKIQAFIDYHLEGIESDLLNTPPIEVQLQNGRVLEQNQWPSERTSLDRYYFAKAGSLTKDQSESFKTMITDNGRNTRIRELSKDLDQHKDHRALFKTQEFSKDMLISGSAELALNVRVANRTSANLSAYLNIYHRGKVTTLTRGWMDPQNSETLEQGQALEMDKFYAVRFKLEPQQRKIPKGARLGLVIASTDYEHTLRPKSGTQIEFNFDEDSYIEMNLGEL